MMLTHFRHRVAFPNWVALTMAIAVAQGPRDFRAAT